MCIPTVTQLLYVFCEGGPVLTLTGASALSVELRLLLRKTFLWSWGLMSILASWVLGQLSMASLSSAGISSQYLHQGEGQQLQVKITSSGSKTDPLPLIAIRRIDRQWQKRRSDDVYSKSMIICHLNIGCTAVVWLMYIWLGSLQCHTGLQKSF